MKLTPKEQNFAELCISLGNQTEAYRQAYKPSNSEAEWLRIQASKLVTRPNINLTIQNLKLQAAKSHGIDRAFIVNGYLEIISDADYTFKLGKDNTLSKDDAKAFYRIMNQTKNTDKIRAMENLAKMLGLNAPEEVNHTHTIKTYKTNWTK
jgi:LPS O-antigen subunit length determinant protein (WzzB/FepE family)